MSLWTKQMGIFGFIKSQMKINQYLIDFYDNYDEDSRLEEIPNFPMEKAERIVGEETEGEI